jgi:hypothetical protein
MSYAQCSVVDIDKFIRAMRIASFFVGLSKVAAFEIYQFLILQRKYIKNIFF